MHYAKFEKKDKRKVCAEKNTSLSCLLFLLRWSQAKYIIHLHRLNIQTTIIIFILFLLCLQGMWRWSECTFWCSSEMKWVPNVLRQNFQINYIFYFAWIWRTGYVITSNAAGSGVVAEQNSCKLHIQFIYWSYRMGQKPLVVTRKAVPVWVWSWDCASVFHLQAVSKAQIPQSCLTW